MCFYSQYLTFMFGISKCALNENYTFFGRALNVYDSLIYQNICRECSCLFYINAHSILSLGWVQCLYFSLIWNEFDKPANFVSLFVFPPSCFCIFIILFHLSSLTNIINSCACETPLEFIWILSLLPLHSAWSIKVSNLYFLSHPPLLLKAYKLLSRKKLKKNIFEEIRLEGKNLFSETIVCCYIEITPLSTFAYSLLLCQNLGHVQIIWAYGLQKEMSPKYWSRRT